MFSVFCGAWGGLGTYGMAVGSYDHGKVAKDPYLEGPKKYYSWCRLLLRLGHSSFYVLY